MVPRSRHRDDKWAQHLTHAPCGTQPHGGIPAGPAPQRVYPASVGTGYIAAIAAAGGAGTLMSCACMHGRRWCGERAANRLQKASERFSLCPCVAIIIIAGCEKDMAMRWHSSARRWPAAPATGHRDKYSFTAGLILARPRCWELHPGDDGRRVGSVDLFPAGASVCCAVPRNTCGRLERRWGTGRDDRCWDWDGRRGS